MNNRNRAELKRAIIHGLEDESSSYSSDFDEPPPRIVNFQNHQNILITDFRAIKEEEPKNSVNEIEKPISEKAEELLNTRKTFKTATKRAISIWDSLY